MASRGISRHRWMTWTLCTTRPCSCTPDSRCKTRPLHNPPSQVGFNIHQKKTQTLKIHAVSKEPVTLNGSPLEEADTFTYLGSIINQQGGTDVDVKTQIGKARAAFTRLKNICKSQLITTCSKVDIFN